MKANKNLPKFTITELFRHVRDEKERIYQSIEIGDFSHFEEPKGAILVGIGARFSGSMKHKFENLTPEQLANFINTTKEYITNDIMDSSEFTEQEKKIVNIGGWMNDDTELEIEPVFTFPPSDFWGALILAVKLKEEVIYDMAEGKSIFIRDINLKEFGINV